jgi:DNA polymerase-3 subunit gamma/tau
LEFPNATNKVEVERQQYDLLSFLRKQLNNYDIILDIKVNEAKEKQFAYTPEEKYDKLKEKNPKIDLLKKIFELDV